MDIELLTEHPFEVRSRFELAAARITESWLGTRRVTVSRDDFAIARDFLERDGWTVEELPGVRVRLSCGPFPGEIMTREAAVLVALRRLSAPSDGRRMALFATRLRLRVAAPLPAERLALTPTARSAEDACRVESPA